MNILAGLLLVNHSVSSTYIHVEKPACCLNFFFFFFWVNCSTDLISAEPPHGACCFGDEFDSLAHC